MQENHLIARSHCDSNGIIFFHFFAVMKWVLHAIVMATASGVYTDSNGKQKKINLALLCQCERAIADISVPRNKNRKLVN